VIADIFSYDVVFIFSEVGNVIDWLDGLVLLVTSILALMYLINSFITAFFGDNPLGS